MVLHRLRQPSPRRQLLPPPPTRNGHRFIEPLTVAQEDPEAVNLAAVLGPPSSGRRRGGASCTATTGNAGNSSPRSAAASTARAAGLRRRPPDHRRRPGPQSNTWCRGTDGAVGAHLLQHGHPLVRLHGHAPQDVTGHRARARWYTTKTEPSYDDMAVKLRRVIIAARFRSPCPEQATPQETRAVLAAWAAAGT